MEAEWRLFPVIKETGDTERLCAQEPHRALLGVTLVIMFPSEEYRRAMEQGLCSQPSLRQALALAPPVARAALSSWPNLPKPHFWHLPTDDNNSGYA